MSKPWLSRILQIVGTLALVVLAAVVCRRTDWCKGVTPDGIMTLIAGVLAFAAVQWQMWDQRRTLRQEVDRQNRAVAKAILFEIDDFYRYHVRGVYGYLEEKARRGELIEVVRIPPSLFAVYRGNTPRLGELPDEVVEVVVHFYSKADKFFALSEDYRAERERHAEPASHPDNWKERTLLGHVIVSLPGLTGAAYIACERLCRFTGVEFKSPRIAIAGEDIAALNRETERIEHEEVHRI